jgi:antirestriction protein
MTDYSDNPKLYCGTYGKYNNGSIAGKWLDMTEYDDAEEFFAACRELHKDEADPEFMFQDFECFPEELYSESLSTKDVEPIIAYAKLDETQRELVTDFCEATGESFGTYDIEQIENAHVFTTDPDDWDSVEEQYGREYASSCMDIPEGVEPYFDYKRYGEDLMQDLSEANGKVFDLNAI